MLKIEGIAEFEAGIDAWLVAVDKLAVDALRGLAVKVFEAALLNSPQFSGNAVANWKFSVDSIETDSDTFFKDLFWETVKAEYPVQVKAWSKDEPNDEAEAYAKSMNAGKDLGVTSLANIIYVSNSVDYADWLGSATLAQLRTQNHIGHTISQSVDDVVEGHLFITTALAEQLARERIG